MVAVSAVDVSHSAAIAGEALESIADRDWGAKACDLDMSARGVLEHVVEGLAFYARDLATPVADIPGDGELALRCAPDASILGLVDGMRQLAAVVARVVAAVPSATRAYHPHGMADPSGFAAMACDEMLIHTDDIAAGLGAMFVPDPQLCERIVTRLFPWAPATGDPWQRLRWANGRTELGDRRRLGPDWRWHCAPLAEWDGTIPSFAR